MQLELCTWPDVQAYLDRSKGVIVPIGSTEQHGPNGLIGTDTITASHLARLVGLQTGAMVAPAIAVGMAQHHMAFAGSITLRPSTLIAVIHDMVTSLVRHGFCRFFFINGHGGNIATVTAAFSELYADASLASLPQRAPIRCRLSNWWMGRGVGGVSRSLFPDAEGSHATPSEVSLSWVCHPEAARPMSLDPPVAPRAGDFTDAADFRNRYPDGRIGSNPGLASIDAGQRIEEAAVAALCREYQDFIGES